MKSFQVRLCPAATLAVTTMLISNSSWAGLSAKDIMSKSEEARRTKEVTATCKLTQQAKAKEFHWARKIAGNGVDFRTFVRFFAPPTVRDEGILILEKNGGDNEVLLYLPAYKKIRRVENQQQTGKFMGSEFSYSDIATPHVDDYTYAGGTLGPCPPDSKASGKCYQVESKPANDRVAERTGYSRSVNWVRSDNFMVVKAESYDPQGALYKRLLAFDIQPAGPEKGRWIAHRTQITNVKTGGSSTIEFSEIKVNSGIPESTFTQQNLAAE